MLEVELKAWADLEAARARLEALGKRPAKESVKEDVYFALEGSDRIVRLRVEDARAVVTTKKKTVEQGVETSEEIEFGVDSSEAVHAFLAHLGFRPFIRKRKESRVWEWRAGVNVELNRIVGLGEFVEVEMLLESDTTTEALQRARDELKAVLRALGVGEEKIEPRGYTALLKERGVGLE